MKKINSIGYGGKIIAVGIVFTCLLPIALWFLYIARKSAVLFLAIKI